MLTAAIIAATAAATVVNAWFYAWPARRLARRLRRDRRSHGGGGTSETTTGFPHAVQNELADCGDSPGVYGEPVSVVMAVRDEEEGLGGQFDRFLNQAYRNFEIVVCNDNSTDRTASLLESYASRHATLRPVTAGKKTHPGKKQALATAIASARSDTLLTTDGDCWPATPHWIERMACQRRASGAEIVLGYSPYERHPGSWLNRWIRFEALYTAAQYLTASLAGRPYMGVGRNLLYSRTLFDRLGGFSAHEHLTGGDDDLLVNAAAHRDNTAVCIHPDAWVYSAAHTTWAAYRRQKRRHLSVSHHYKRFDKLWLAALAGSHVAHYLGLLALLLTGGWAWAGVLYAARLAIVWPRVATLAGGLGQGDLGPLVPVADLAVAGYYTWSANSLHSTSSTSSSWQ